MSMRQTFKKREAGGAAFISGTQWNVFRHETNPWITTCRGRKITRRWLTAMMPGIGGRPQFNSGTSRRQSITHALDEAVRRAATRLSFPQATPPLVLVLVGRMLMDLDGVQEITQRALRRYGWEADGVSIVGGVVDSVWVDDEWSASGIGVFILSGQDISQSQFCVGPEANLDWSQSQWREKAGCMGSIDDITGMLLFQDLLVENSATILSGLDFAFPEAMKAGLVMGETLGSSGSVFYQGDLRERSIVGIAMKNDSLRLTPVTSRGVRPVGPILEVVEVRDDGMILSTREVGTSLLCQGAPLSLLEMWEANDTITSDERRAAERGLMIGIIHTGDLETEARHANREPEWVDYIVRKVTAFDSSKAGIAIGGEIRVGQLIQFLISDPRATMDDLSIQLGRLKLESRLSTTKDSCTSLGYLVLIDSERATDPSQEVRLIVDTLGPLPMIAVRCPGQISSITGSPHRPDSGALTLPFSNFETRGLFGATVCFVFSSS